MTVVDDVYYSDLLEARRNRWSRLLCRLFGHRWGEEELGISLTAASLKIRRCERCLGRPA
jgi:hypothetical protein